MRRPSILPVLMSAILGTTSARLPAQIPRCLRPRAHAARIALLAALAVLAGCTAPPDTPPLARYEPDAGYRLAHRFAPGQNPHTLFVLAFSGGGTRAAAFAYGVLEELRRTRVGPADAKTSLLSRVNIISGVSGGSITALAYALHGDRMFDIYEQQFLNRDVEGELIRRVLNPLNWPKLMARGYGRSEVAAEFYDEILFRGATFGDLASKPTPLAIVSSTDIATGFRWSFSQAYFDIICADLAKMPLARAAAASSAVPVILSPVTLENHGSTCGYRDPPWVVEAIKAQTRPWAANRAAQRYRDLQSYEDRHVRPYLHLVDGSLAGNLGVDPIVEALQEMEASALFRAFESRARFRRVAIIIVNARALRSLEISQSPSPPSTLEMLSRSVIVPIDRDSYASVDALQDLVTEWRLERRVAIDKIQREGRPIPPDLLPDLDFSIVDASFDAVQDPAEREYLLGLPTNLSLPPEAISRLRAAAAQALRESPTFRELVEDFSKNP
jgi:NTE family protein